jgi:hypothetical protein
VKFSFAFIALVAASLLVSGCIGQKEQKPDALQNPAYAERLSNLGLSLSTSDDPAISGYTPILSSAQWVSRTGGEYGKITYADNSGNRFTVTVSRVEEPELEPLNCSEIRAQEYKLPENAGGQSVCRGMIGVEQVGYDYYWKSGNYRVGIIQNNIGSDGTAIVSTFAKRYPPESLTPIHPTKQELFEELLIMRDIGGLKILPSTKEGLITFSRIPKEIGYKGTWGRVRAVYEAKTSSGTAQYTAQVDFDDSRRLDTKYCSGWSGSKFAEFNGVTLCQGPPGEKTTAYYWNSGFFGVKILQPPDQELNAPLVSAYLAKYPADN